MYKGKPLKIKGTLGACLPSHDKELIHPLESYSLRGNFSAVYSLEILL
jgi:hypothetical protein